MNDDLISRKMAIDSIQYAGKIGKKNMRGYSKEIAIRTAGTEERSVAHKRTVLFRMQCAPTRVLSEVLPCMWR